MNINHQIQLLSQLYQAYTDNSLKNLELDTKTGTLKEEGFIKKIFVNLQYAFSSETKREALKEKKVRNLTEQISQLNTPLYSSSKPTIRMVAEVKEFIYKFNNITIHDHIREKLDLSSGEDWFKLREHDIDNILKKIDSLPKNTEGVRDLSKLNLTDTEYTQLELAKKNLHDILEDKGFSEHPASSERHPDHALFKKCRKIRSCIPKIDYNQALEKAEQMHVAFAKKAGAVSVAMETKGSFIVSKCSKKQLQAAFQLLKKEMPFFISNREYLLERTKLLLIIMHGKEAAEKIINQDGFQEDLNVFELSDFYFEEYKTKTLSESLKKNSLDPQNTQSVFLAFSMYENAKTDSLLKEFSQCLLKDFGRATYGSNVGVDQITGIAEIIPQIIQVLKQDLLKKINSDENGYIIQQLKLQHRILNEDIFPDFGSDKLRTLISQLPENTDDEKGKKQLFEKILTEAANIDMNEITLANVKKDDIKKLIFQHIMTSILLHGQATVGAYMSMANTMGPYTPITNTLLEISSDNKGHKWNDNVKLQVMPLSGISGAETLVYKIQKDGFFEYEQQILLQITDENKIFAKGVRYARLNLLPDTLNEPYGSFQPYGALRFNANVLDIMN